MLSSRRSHCLSQTTPWPRSPLCQYPDLIRTPVTRVPRRTHCQWIGISTDLATSGLPWSAGRSPHFESRRTQSALQHTVQTDFILNGCRAFRSWDSSVSIVTRLTSEWRGQLYPFLVWERIFWCPLNVHAGSAVRKAPRVPRTLSSRIKWPELEDDHSSTISTSLIMNGDLSSFQYMTSWFANTF